jgi:beta-galactosidase
MFDISISNIRSTLATLFCFAWIASASGGRAQAVAPADLAGSTVARSHAGGVPRERILLDSGWKFHKYDATEKADDLIYDVRPELKEKVDYTVADAKPTEAVKIEEKQEVLKPWILPTGNDFIKDPSRRYRRPTGDPGGNFPFVQAKFDDSAWESVTLPHDWAIQGPFYTGVNPKVGGDMAHLPVPGVAWYRRKLEIPGADTGKSIFLDVDGAMSYAMVWLNGHLVGGWPYGYTSWRVDLTPYIVPGGENQLAIRLDNPAESSRWYPGGGIYRNVWLVKTQPIHVGHWGTYLTTPQVSISSATVDLAVTLNNDAKSAAKVGVATQIYLLDAFGEKTGSPVASIAPRDTVIAAEAHATVKGTVAIANPKLWGPPPTQVPNLYVAVTTVSQDGRLLDSYETRFGLRSLRFDAKKGILVNGEHIVIQGANQHSDLGALGMAFNTRAAERQLELLREAGCNAIRLSHNPPAPELLELLDRMGFLVVDEIFDAWEKKKPTLDFHLIFPDWSEQDLRAMIRRDRNSPSVILWSFGNEVGEQYSGEDGAAMAKRLIGIVKDEDPSRLATASLNYAKPDMPMPGVLDVISLNYQGEGIRNGEAYSGLQGISAPPLFSAFHKKFPGKVILSSENAATVSSRGEYQFPVYKGNSAPVKDGQGGDRKTHQVSAYELYTAPFGASPDKVFATEDKNPFVAGGFVWSGWDYLGEPTPYYSSRSSYFGIIDLAGFKKDRFYLYQSRWRPDLPMAHILPHWTWPERVGKITPVHVFTSGDEAELFLNGKSLGRKKKELYEYRLRWDDVVYEAGELKVVAYKQGKEWAEDSVKTAGAPERLELTADHHLIHADGRDLAFVTVKVSDKGGLMAPRANNHIQFMIDGPGEIVATDNGDPTSVVPFPSHERDAFNGLCLVIVRSKPGEQGEITLTAKSGSLQPASLALLSVPSGERVETHKILYQH